MTSALAYGIYDALLDETLREALARHPELRAVLGKIEVEEQPTRYAAFVARVLEQALREEPDSARRLSICNRFIALISKEAEHSHLEKRHLVEQQKTLLLEVTPPNYGTQSVPRPHTSLTESSLFTGSPQEPQLAHELQKEMCSADAVDILVSFIKWSGLRLLMSAFEDLRERHIPVRLITTSYMGASDAPAVEWLANLPNVEVRVSYDTERTRLHAKAYHFRRLSGFSTAYIGSANMSHAAITSGLEWNLKVTAQDMGHIFTALHRYEPNLMLVKGIGFCITIIHARYMAEMFTAQGIPSAALVTGVGDEQRSALLADFRIGKITFLFTVDVLNEGLDVPQVNTVMFLRPTESLTVFLQQLGRGLRHAPEKDCLTVLDFVGQAHRRYRIDSKLKALLPKHRFAIDREVELDFPHLPAGCSIQLDRLSRQYVLDNIRTNLRNLTVQIPERLKTFEHETRQNLTFKNFVTYHDYEPEVLLSNDTWSGWKARAQLTEYPVDPDLTRLKPALVRAASISGPHEIQRLRKVVENLRRGRSAEALTVAEDAAINIHYRVWGKPGAELGMVSLQDSFQRLSRNPSILTDLYEVLEWAEAETTASGQIPQLPFPCAFELHAQYGINEIKAPFGLATFARSGQRGVGSFHFQAVKAYALLITFQKTEREFSPSTMYADYPISRELLHWESQSMTSQDSETGQNLINHVERGYTILIFARDQKRRNNCAVPFTYLGSATRVSYESERPIRMVWRMNHPIPVEMFEENRRGG